jgi:hypothetical protein
VALFATSCGGESRPPLVVGAFESSAKHGDAAAEMARARRAGFRAIVFSSVWRRPLVAPSAEELTELRRAADAAVAAGIRPIVAVYGFSADTPLGALDRSQFASYVAAIVRDVPAIRDIVAGNEPNLPLFWQPQFDAAGNDAAAPGYLRLLADTYDAVKAVDPDINVIGGSLAARGGDRPLARRPTISPTRFLADLGAAYRASGRDRPVMDMFSIHPYPEHSSIPPSFAHPRSSSIGLADYEKLVRLLDDALPGELPIVYGEYGLETTIPPAKAGAYEGDEPATTKPVDPLVQGRRHARAIELAACQPRVRMLIFFHVGDESDLRGLQTGVYYADDTPKPSLPIVAAAVRRAESGELQCRP